MLPAAAAVAAIFWLVRPVGLGILLGTLLAFLAQPVCVRLTPRLGARWAVLTTTIASGLALAAVLGGLGWLFVSRGTALSSELVAAVGPDGFIGRALARASSLTERFGVTPDELRGHLSALTGAAAGSAARVAETIAAATASALLGLFFAMLAMHHGLRHGERLSQRAADVLPLRPAYTRSLLTEFRRVGRATLFGSVVTGIVQGTFAAIGFWITGVPEPLFFGALTIIASFVPVAGVLLVVVPAGLGLLFAGHPIGGII